MGAKLGERSIWYAYRIVPGATRIELREYKPYESLSVGLYVIPFFLFGAALIYALSAGLDPVGASILAVILSVPVLWCLLKYRPPRYLRVYPQVQLIEVGRYCFGFAKSSRWCDLSDGTVVMQTIAMSDVSRRSPKPVGLRHGIGLVLWLTGPLGWILSFVLGFREEWKKEDLPGYAISISGSDPLAIFLDDEQAIALREVLLDARTEHIP